MTQLSRSKRGLIASTISLFLSASVLVGQISIYEFPSSADVHEEIAQLALSVETGRGPTEDVRALFGWITQNVEYDMSAAVGRRVNTGPLDVLRTRKAICFGYAQLLRDMCAALDIPAFVVSGYGTVNRLISEINEPNHAWNAVFLEGRWFFFDATWSRNSSDKEYFMLSPDEVLSTHTPAFAGWLLTDCVATAALDAEICGLDDSLKVFLASTPVDRAIMECRSDFVRNPTEATKRNLGQAILDKAFLLQDTADARRDSAALSLYGEALSHFQAAEAYVDTFFVWQDEALANTYLSRATLNYNLLAGPEYNPVRLAEVAVDLRHGIAILERGGFSLMAQTALAQANQSLAHVEAEILRLSE